MSAIIGRAEASKHAPPPVLVTARTHDTRVPPVQALKQAERFGGLLGRAGGAAPRGGRGTGDASLHDSRQAHALRLAWNGIQFGRGSSRALPESSIFVMTRNTEGCYGEAHAALAHVTRSESLTYLTH